MKQTIGMILVLLGLCFFKLPVSAYSIDNLMGTKKYVYSEDTCIFIRNKPSYDAEIVGIMPPRTQLPLMNEDNNDWYAILFEDEIYYVSKNYASIEESKEPISADDVRLLSALVYAEAGNQCYAGQQAVAIVVLNRVHSELFENSIEDVIYEPKQFQVVEVGTLDKALKKYDNEELPQSCIDAAVSAIQGYTSVIYLGQKYEMNNLLFFSRYVKGKKVQIEDHMFK